MSHASGVVRFRDGKFMFYEYNGTADVVISHLHDTMQGVLDGWRKSPWLDCKCDKGMEPVEIYSSYGGGFYWDGMACRTCRAIDGGGDDARHAGSDGEPPWYKDIPPELKKSEF